MKITELLAQLPPTDIEIEVEKASHQPPSPEPTEPTPTDGTTKPARKKPAVKLPTPELAPKEPSKFTGPNPALAATLCDQVLAGGQASLLELLAQIHPVTDPAYQNYKAEYLFHCLVVHVGQPGKERQKQRLAEFLASQIGNDKLPKPTRAFLVRELQWLGGRESIRALDQLLTDNDLCEPAAAALLNIGADVAPVFIAALPRANAGCRLILTQNLAALGTETAQRALRSALQDTDATVRSAAAWGLARLGDESSVDALLKMAAPPTWLLLAETLLAKTKKRAAARIYQHILATRTEKHLQQLAARALAVLGR